MRKSHILLTTLNETSKMYGTVLEYVTKWCHSDEVSGWFLAQTMLYISFFALGWVKDLESMTLYLDALTVLK